MDTYIVGNILCVLCVKPEKTLQLGYLKFGRVALGLLLERNILDLSCVVNDMVRGLTILGQVHIKIWLIVLLTSCVKWI